MEAEEEREYGCEYGCPQRFTRDELLRHLLECPKVVVPSQTLIEASENPSILDRSTIGETEDA
jgi:hypothetical protein